MEHTFTSKRVLVFLWKLCHQILPVRLVLAAKHLQVLTECPFFDQTGETAHHHFIQCEFSRAVSFVIDLSIRVHAVHSQNVVKWLMCWLENGTRHPHVNIELTCPIAVIMYGIYGMSEIK